MAKHTLLLTVSAAFLTAACSDSDPVAETALGDSVAAAQPNGITPSPTAAALADSGDGSLLTLSGRVVATAPDWFRLRAGDEELTVEMDDWDWYQEGRSLKVGDRVTVTGRVDKGLWEQKKIEASSVYVQNLGVSFLADGADEEERTAALIQVGTATTSAQGVVSSVEGREFTVGSMSGPVRVDMSQLKAKPALKVGSRVYTWGTLDVEPAEGVELMAEGLALLSADRTKKDASAAPRQANGSNTVS